jgi:hypothetical protein
MFVRRRDSHIYLGKRITDGDEVVSFKGRPAALTPRKIPSTHFRNSRTQDHSATGRIRSI